MKPCKREDAVWDWPRPFRALFFGPESRGNGVNGDDTIGVEMTVRL